MDDYVSKPVTKEKLAQAMKRICDIVPSHRAEEEKAAPPDDGGFSCEKLVAQFDGDHALLERVAALFVESVPQSLQQLCFEAAASDLPAVAQTAHTIRGSLANIGALHGAAIAAEIEESAHKEMLADVNEHIVELHYEIDTILTELERCLIPAGVAH